MIRALVLLIGISGFANAGHAQALIARTNITMSGNIVVDSFDSSDPNYSTNGYYISSRRKDGGDIVLTDNSTNSSIVLSVSLGGSLDVFGKIYIGSNCPSVQIPTNFTAIGSLVWIATNSGVEPGWMVTYEGGYLSNAPSPPFSTGLPLPTKTVNTLDGIFYANSYLLTSGNYKQISNVSLTSSDKILVQGNVKLHVQGNLSLAGNSQIRIGTNSSLTIYASSSLDFSGGGVANGTGRATNLTIYGQNTCTNIKVAGGSEFTGVIYAPFADYKQVAGGATPLNFSGNIVANTATLSGKSQIHYDESLPPITLFPTVAATLISQTVTTNGTASFNLIGVPTYTYALESSTNLSDWSRVMTNSSPFTFTNIPTGVPQQFYRAVYLP